MKAHISRRYVQVIAFITLWIGASFSLLYYSPEGLIDLIGIKNAYFFLFALAFLSGISIFGGIPYHLVLIALAAGGLDPLLLALAAGVMLGDSTSYFIGYQGRIIVPEAFERRINVLSSWLAKYPRRVPFFFLLYGSLVPFSNDFVGITTGLARYPFARVMLPLGVGNLIFNATLALLSPYLYDTLHTLFT